MARGDPAGLFAALAVEVEGCEKLHVVSTFPSLKVLAWSLERK